VPAALCWPPREAANALVARDAAAYPANTGYASCASVPCESPPWPLKVAADVLTPGVAPVRCVGGTKKSGCGAGAGATPCARA
jgi:hypothetical protein